MINRRVSAGFSLIELLIVIAVIGVLAVIGVPLIQGYMNGAREQKAIARLANIGSAANTFRTTMGRRRYPTLAELNQRLPGQTSPLISPWDAPVDPGGNPVASEGWVVQEAETPTANTFAVYASQPDRPGTVYTVFEDGVVRKPIDGSTTDRNAPPVVKN